MSNNIRLLFFISLIRNKIHVSGSALDPETLIYVHVKIERKIFLCFQLLMHIWYVKNWCILATESFDQYASMRDIKNREERQKNTKHEYTYLYVS